MFNNYKLLFTDFLLEFLSLLLLSLALLWGYMYKRIRKATEVIEEQKGRIEFLENELEACRKIKIQHWGNQTNQSEFKSEITTSADEASKIQKRDDLKIVEGIGPKIEGLLFEAGIFTFEQLSHTEVAAIKKILDKAGTRYQMHNPATWPSQAALARDDKWDELKKWQAELNKGRIIHL
jgi:predicted flap endonuclease-1-like 5' DNA nuclease